jgi:hypothetical protein
MYAHTSTIHTMGPVLRHILQFNLDFGAGRYSNTIAVEIAFPVAACPYIHASYELLAGQGCTNSCISLRYQQNPLRQSIPNTIFFQQITVINILRTGKLLRVVK